MRLFIAIKLNKDILDSLVDFQGKLRTQGVTGNYTKRENLHITLAFIGDYNNPDEVADAIKRADPRPMEIILEGIGRYDSMLWAGITDNPMLAGYVKRLRRELSDSGIPYDRKNFSPHITLIRKAAYKGGNRIPVSDPPNGNMKVTGISLMRSERGKNGMIYTEIYCVDAGG